MNKEEKSQIIAEFQEKFQKASGIIFTDYKGLTVEEISSLRSQLRDASLEYKIVKNTLAKRASGGTPVETAKEVFTGPVGIAFGYDDPVLLTKKLLDFAKKNEKLKVIRGVIEGKICEAADLKSISTLPSREILLATFAGMLQSPLSKLASALNATLVQIAYALEALKNKKSEA